MQWQQERAWFTQVFLQSWSLPSVLTVYHSGQWYILAFVQKAKILLGTSLKFHLPIDQLLSQLGWNWRSQYLQTVGTRPGSALMEEWGRSCVMEIVCESPPASIQYHQYALRYIGTNLYVRWYAIIFFCPSGPNIWLVWFSGWVPSLECEEEAKDIRWQRSSGSICGCSSGFLKFLSLITETHSETFLDRCIWIFHFMFYQQNNYYHVEICSI